MPRLGKRISRGDGISSMTRKRNGAPKANGVSSDGPINAASGTTFGISQTSNAASRYANAER